MIKTLILSLLIIAVAIVIMGVNALFRKGKSFPSGHSHDLAMIPRRQAQLRKKIIQSRNNNKTSNTCTD